MTDDEVGACLKAMCYREVGPGVWWKAFGYMGFSYQVKNHKWACWYRPANAVEEFQKACMDSKSFPDIQDYEKEDFLVALQSHEHYVHKVGLPMTNWLTSTYSGYM